MSQKYVQDEIELLAAVINGADPADAEHITEQSFFIEGNGTIWSILKKLHDQQMPMDAHAIKIAIRDYPYAPVNNDMVDRVFAKDTEPSKIGELAHRVADNAVLFRLREIGRKINNFGELDNDLSYTSVAELYDQALQELEELPKHFAYRDNPSAAPGPLEAGFTAQDLMAQKFEPLEYVVPGVITEGLGMIVAAPKIGKSWMMLGIGIACAEGGLAFNAIQVDQRPVLYLALEDGPRRLQDRLRTLGATTGSPNLTFMTDIPAGAMLTIGTFIEQHAARKPLVILDTLGKARDVYGGNDAYQKDYKELSDYKRLVDQHPGSTLLIVHHTNKGAHGDFVSSVSGTQGITGAADSILTLERGRGDGEAILNVTSRDAAEGSYAMTFDNGRWILDGANLTEAANAVNTRKAVTGVGDAMTEVIELVSKHPEGIKPKDVATLLHWEDYKARTYLRRAYESGRIQRLERGLYTPVSSVSSVSFDNGMNPIDTQDTQVTRLYPNGNARKENS